MSSLPLAKIDRVFSVGPAGETVITRRPPPRALTSGQRHAAWRIGLMAVNAFMEKHGFASNVLGSGTHFGWRSGKFYVNVSLRKPGNIAYVTSSPDYNPAAKRTVLGKDATGAEIYGVTASVTTLKQALGGGKYTVMVDVSHEDGRTQNPVYVPLTDVEERPAEFVYKNTLGVIAMLCRSIPGMVEAFKPDSVRQAQELPVDDSYLLED